MGVANRVAAGVGYAVLAAVAWKTVGTAAVAFVSNRLRR